MDVFEKQIAVLGLGRSGASVAKLLHSKGARVTVFESTTSPSLEERAASLRRENIPIKFGSLPETSEAFDLAVVSPGIHLENRLVKSFSEMEVPITGELEVAWQFCEKPVIAITGTNGKTTTTELISVMLNSVGIQTVACGNIGLPFSDVVKDSQGSIEMIVVEVSSFQLETISTFSPKIALWLNFSADHLDRYSSIQEYYRAKSRIFEFQKEENYTISNALGDCPPVHSNKITFSAYTNKADFYLNDESLMFRSTPIALLNSFQIVGKHNAENIMAALSVGHILKLPFSDLLPALQKYHPAPHRCELVRYLNGVSYINDSKSTNPDALASALNSFDKRLVLIAGGKDKGFLFSNLLDLVKEKVSCAILIGEIALQIKNSWQVVIPIRIAATLQEAVELASQIALPESTVLFSPGTSSFDMFQDYADRGNQFRNAVENLCINKTNS